MDRVKYLLWVFLFSATLLNCKDDELINRGDINIEVLSGNDQSGTINTTLKEQIVVKVTDRSGNPLLFQPVTFHQNDWGYSFNTIGGDNGYTDPIEVYSDSSGIASTNWTLGCKDGLQSIYAYVLDYNSNKADSVILESTGIPPTESGWRRSCGIIKCSFTDTHFRSHSDELYVSNYDLIYNSIDNGASWQIIDNMPPFPKQGSVFDFQFNSDGWMYAVGRYDGVYYTSDKVNWTEINNGIENYSDPISFLLEDSCMFISYYSDGVFKSSNNGESWEQINIDSSDFNKRYKFINRHPNGNIYLFDNNDFFWVSNDNGSSWNKVILENQSNYKNQGISDFIIDNDGNFIIASNDATLRILSLPNYTGSSYSYYDAKSNYIQTINDLQIQDGIIYFNDYGTTKPDVYSSQNWSALNLGFDIDIYTFTKLSGDNFILASNNGIFYYQK